MEAVGSEVFLALLPLFVVLVLGVYTFRAQIKETYRKIHVYVFGRQQINDQDPENRPIIFGESQCSICLDQPKQFEIAGTCGHSFCSQCLFTIYERNYQKLDCPLCRKPITTLFKCFNNLQQPAQRRGQIITKIHQYNQKFDDNRPLIRRFQQFPHVLRRIGRQMIRPRFWFGFIRSYYFFKVIMMAFIYFILPIDLIPQRLFGIVGFIDDIVIFGLLILFGVVLFAPIFIRRDR